MTSRAKTGGNQVTAPTFLLMPQVRLPKRTLERRPFARAMRSLIGRPFGFLRWMSETEPCFDSHASFFLDRQAVSAQTFEPVSGRMTRSS